MRHDLPAGAPPLRIDDGQQGRVVVVPVFVIGVMPVVEGRRGHQPLQRAETPVQIAVDEERPGGARQRDNDRQKLAVGAGGGQAQCVERRQAAEAGEHHVRRMRARAHQPVHGLRTVVHLVKAPEERRLVAQAVPPIGADLAHDDPGQDLDPQRQAGDRVDIDLRCDPLRASGDDRDRYRQYERGRQPIQEVVGEIARERTRAHAPWMKREEALQRQEYDRQDHQPEREAGGLHSQGDGVLHDVGEHTPLPLPKNEKGSKLAPLPSSARR